MASLTRKVLAATAAGLLGFGLAAPSAQALPVVDLPLPPLTTVGSAVGLSSDGKSVSKFVLNLPSTALSKGKIVGLTGDTRLVGIDFRVQDNQVYGVGNAGGVYVLEGRQAQKVSQLTVALSGKSFGVDFNPAADRLRVVSDSGQNLRHDVNAGGVTIADVPLTRNGVSATGIVAAAYVNNDLDPSTPTTLYDIDAKRDVLVEQTPANDGTLTDVGRLGRDAGATTGFDILSTVVEGVTVENSGWMTARGGLLGTSTLYTVDLQTGRTRTVGTFLLADVADLAIVQTR